MNYLFFNLIFFLMSIVLFVKYYEHLLMILMCLEFLVLIILMLIFFNLVLIMKEFYYLVFMMFFVIDSILGLVFLISLVHFKGNDHLKMINLMMW